MALTKPKGSIIDLSSGDKVGIGTTSPGATLEVKNKSVGEGETENSNIFLKNSGGTNTITLNTASNVQLKMQVGASGNLFVMDYSGSSGSEVLALNVGGNDVFEMGHNGYVNFGDPGNTSLVKNVTITDTNDVRLYLESTSVSSGTTLGKLSWCAAESQSTENARIEAIAQGAVNAGQLQFRTRSSSTSSGENNTPVNMVINPAGRLGIGTTSPSSQLHLKTQNSTSADNSGAGFYVLDHATDSFRYAQVWLNADGGEYGYTSDGNFAYLEKRSSATDGGSLRLHNGDSGPIEFWTRNTGGSGLSKKMELDSDGNLKIISGMGVLRTVYGVRAWVNFNGTGTVAIRDSGNVSSITDDGTGNYSVNFTTAMPDANYAVLGTAGHTSASNLIALTVNRVSGSLPATGSVHVYTSYANTYAFDSINTSVAIVR